MRTHFVESLKTTEVEPQTVALWWIGQSGFIIKLPNGRTLVIDPYLSNSVAQINPLLVRQTPLPLLPAEVNCDYCLCTHNHLDHADPETIKALPGLAGVRFVGPRNVIRMLRKLGVAAKNLFLLEAGDSLNLEGFTLRGTFCIPNEENVLDSIGILLQTDNGPTLYHTGDTGYHPFLHYLKKYAIDGMMTCINGKYGNMSAAESFTLASVLNPRLVIPTHYDMFALNAADPQAFKELFENQQEVVCQVPHIGERIIARIRPRMKV